MADERLRDSERQWGASGAVEDEVSVLRNRRHAGQLSEQELRLAAALGSEAAQRVVGVPELDIPEVHDNHSLIIWVNRVTVATDLEEGIRLGLSSLREGLELMDDSVLSTSIRQFFGQMERYWQRDEEVQRRELPLLNVWINDLYALNDSHESSQDSFLRLILVALMDWMLAVYGYRQEGESADTSLRLRLNTVHSSVCRAFQDPAFGNRQLTEKQAAERLWQRCRVDLLGRLLKHGEDPKVDQGEETQEIDISQFREQIGEQLATDSDSEDPTQSDSSER